MRAVVDYYRSLRVQPEDCDDCRYILFEDAEDCPDGFETMRNRPSYISQCSEHNKPLHQWLWSADRDDAAERLVRQGEASETGTVTIDALQKELTGNETA